MGLRIALILAGVGVVVLVGLAITLTWGDGALMSQSVCDEVRSFDDESDSLVPGQFSETPVDDLGSLVPSQLPAGQEPVSNMTFATASDDAATRCDPVAWEAELVRDGYQHGFMRTWADPAAGSQWRVEVQQFDTQSGALAFHDWADQFSCRYSDEVFAGFGAVGASGLRIRYHTGMVQERMSFVRGSRRYAVSLETDGAEPDHARISSLTRIAMQGAR